jgi:uroporphyrinogen-III synthase
MRVFFSSEVTPDHPLVQATQTLSLELIATPLIAFAPLKNLPTQNYDVIFFSSPRSYEFGKTLIRSEVLVACYAAGTAKHLPRVDWQGSTPGNPAQTAQAFQQWVGNRRVLFPVSQRSLGSIARVFPEAQKEVLPVYQTLLAPQSLPDCSVYLFTSPSNVEAFMLSHAFPPGAKVFAWGESTKTYLINHGVVPDFCRSDEAILDWVALLSAWVNP